MRLDECLDALHVHLLTVRRRQGRGTVRTSLPQGITVSGGVLHWARVSLNIPLEVAASKLGVTHEALEDWERDGAQLRLTEIETLARVYRRPSAVFFLRSAPSEPPLPHDHRTVPSQSRHQLGPKSILAVRLAQRIQSEAQEVSRLLGSSLQSKVPRVTLDADPEETAHRLRRALDVPLDVQFEWRDDYKALRGWVDAVERLGVLVLRQSMPVEETRGFAISGVPAVIVLNSADGVPPRIFSLAHELVHVALGMDSICDTRLGPYDSHSEAIEVFCNRVAGAIVVPADALAAHPLAKGVGPDEWDETRLRRIANQFKVSQEVVLRRLLVKDLTTKDFYRHMRREWKRRPLPARGPGGGADPVGDCIREHSRPFAQLVSEATKRGVLSFGEAAEVLDVKTKYLGAVFERVT